MTVADARDSGFGNIWGAVAVLALAGCAVPPAVTIASFAVDGVSYASSGKSVQDHALSALAEQDCALWRVTKGNPVCSPVEAVEADVQVAAVEPADEAVASDAPVQLAQFTPPPMTPWAKVVPAPAPAVRPDAPRAPEQAGDPMSGATQAALALQPATGATAVAAAAVASSAKAEPPATHGLYVVLASFEDQGKALSLARARGGDVLAATVNGRTMHRVVSGPFDRAHAQQVRRENAGAWLITL
jgi:hypothetical protein